MIKYSFDLLNFLTSVRWQRIFLYKPFFTPTELARQSMSRNYLGNPTISLSVGFRMMLGRM